MLSSCAPGDKHDMLACPDMATTLSTPLWDHHLVRLPERTKVLHVGPIATRLLIYCTEALVPQYAVNGRRPAWT